MARTGRGRTLAVWGVSLVAVIFGALTVRAGAGVLFGGPAARRAAGDVVPFVLWFNFLAGFAYIAAGAGLWLERRWGVWLAVLIAAATVLVFAAFGAAVTLGVAYEPRTVAAMTVRALVWLAIGAAAWRLVPGSAPGPAGRRNAGA